MSDEAIHLSLFLIGTIFSAGGFYVYVKFELKQLGRDARRTHEELLRDIDGIGGSLRRAKDDAATHYHNLTMAILVAAPVEKETEVTKLLKEG